MSLMPFKKDLNELIKLEVKELGASTDIAIK